MDYHFFKQRPDREGDNLLEAELMEEKAASYLRILRKMQGALEKLAALDEQLAQSPKLPETLRKQRHQLLLEAAEYVWFFIVQREILGMSVRDEIYADYEIPEEVRRIMGPRDKDDKPHP